MKINRDNYPAFFLEYWESGLSEEEKSALDDFLQENPDLMDEFLECRNLPHLKIQPEISVKFPEKKSFIKTEVNPVGPIDAMNWEEYTIAWLEGDLDSQQAQEFEQFLKINPHLHKEVELFRLTRLIPEPITFDNKKAFIRPTGSRVILQRKWVKITLATAATILLGLVFHMALVTLIIRKDHIDHPVAAEPTLLNNDTTLFIHIPLAKNFNAEVPQSDSISQDIFATTTNSSSNWSSGADPLIHLGPTSNSWPSLTRLTPILSSVLSMENDGKSAKSSIPIRGVQSNVFIARLTDSDSLGVDQSQNNITKLLSKLFQVLPITPVVKETTSSYTDQLLVLSEKGRDLVNRSDQIKPVLKVRESEESIETIFAWSNTITFKAYRIKQNSRQDN